MQQPFVYEQGLQEQFARSRGLLVLWAIVLLSCASYTGLKVYYGTAFTSNIMGLIPDSADRAEAEVENRVRSQLTGLFERRFALLVAGANPEQGLNLAKALQTELTRSSLIELNTNEASTADEISRFYEPYRYQLLADDTREWLANNTAETIAQNTLNTLYNPLGELRPYAFQKDPFNLGGAWLSTLSEGAAQIQHREIPSVESGDEHWYILSGSLRESPFELETQHAVQQAIFNFEYDKQDAEFSLRRSGLVFHAGEAAQAAQQEISTVGLGSLLAIFLLVLVAFGSAQSLGAILFTLGSSTLVALTTTLLVFEQVHLVTLAFGTTLLGLAADYCFHFLVKSESSGNPLGTAQVLKKGLIICTVSSIAAYLFQLMLPFPGLRQFAVFVASGLATAYGSIFLLAQFYRPKNKPSDRPGNAAYFSRFLGLYQNLVVPCYEALAGKPKICIAAAILVIVVAFTQVHSAGVRDDIRLLNSSSQALLESEQHVRDLLGGIDSQRYFLIEGADEQKRLERAESLIRGLKPSGQSGKGGADQLQLYSIANLIPSFAQQKRDYELVQTKLFGTHGALPLLCIKLGMSCKEFISTSPKFQNNLTPEALPDALKTIMPAASISGDNYAVVLLNTAIDDTGLMLEEGVRYVNQVKNFSNLLATYRSGVGGLLGAFILALAAFMIWRFRTMGFAVLLPLLMSISLSLAISAPLGVSLFHMLALLLVLGISIDTTVFYLEPGLSSETWLASTLASFTSLAAFGLLAFSNIPVLHQFGMVVFSGLLCLWLITPLIFFALKRAQPAIAS